MYKIIQGDNLEILKTIPDNSVALIYTDPPFNTGHKQKRAAIKTIQSNDGLIGFGGNKYDRIDSGQYGSFNDNFDDYIGFLRSRIIEAYRILKDTGSFYLHINWRECAYVKVMLDEIFGRENFINEIIWAYDYGAKSKKKWSAKHDNILFYVKDKNHYTFNYDKIPRIPYLAPKLAGQEKAAR